MRIVKKVFIGLIVIIGLYALTRWGYGEISYVYFQHKCEQDAGEFIYKTVENVEGLYQMRPRDPRDYFDRLRYGDIPEDPYGHTNWEAQEPESLFIDPPRANYKYLETTRIPNSKSNFDRRFPKTRLVEDPIITGEKYWNYKLDGQDKNGRSLFIAEQKSHLKSKHGYKWQEVRNDWDRFLGVWGGELIVKELESDEILGIRRGYFYQDRFTKRIDICPKDKTDTITYDFISQVLKPAEDTSKGDK